MLHKVHLTHTYTHIDILVLVINYYHYKMINYARPASEPNTNLHLSNETETLLPFFPLIVVLRRGKFFLWGLFHQHTLGSEILFFTANVLFALFEKMIWSCLTVS